MKKNKGFTIVEMLVVVALIAILLTLVLVNLNKNRAKARDNIRISDINVIRLALDEYRNYCGVYPATLALDTNNSRTSLSRTSTNGCDKNMGDFLPEELSNEQYSTDNNKYYQDHPTTNESTYMYYGTSHIQNGPCFGYVIGVQLEYGSSNSFEDGEHKALLANNDNSTLAPGNARSHTYYQRCQGSEGNGIVDADNNTYGIYGFRSASQT